MAGPSIAVRVLADLKQFASSMEGTGKNAQSAGSRIKGAFDGVLSTLNRTGVLGPFGVALAGVSEALDQIAGHAKTVGAVMIGAGGVIAGVGATLSTFGSKEQAAHNQLSAAIDATGHSYDEYGKQIEEAVKHNEHFGQSSAATQGALQILTQATHDPQKALDLLGTATNIAAAKHEDLASAAGQLGKVYNGNTRLLKEFGITVDKNTGKTKDGQTATEALAGVVAGQASAAADTFTGKLKAISTQVEDQVSQFGARYGPAITAAGGAITVLGGAIEATTALVNAMRDSELAATVVEYAMSAPVLIIIAALAALGVAAYLIYRNWGTIWSGMKAAVEAVWNWIKTNWPLLVGILLGPIGIAAALIYKYWDQIRAGAAAVVNWIRAVWPVILGYLTAPFVSAWQAIARGFDALVATLAGLPGRIAGIAGRMWDSILQAFRGMVNGIIDIWNGLHFTLPKVDAGPIHIGGETVGVPRIPHLASGGLITSDGLIYAHAGEAITPANGRTGPAVVVQNANFSSGLDVESFMKRAAWVVRTAAV